MSSSSKTVFSLNGEFCAYAADGGSLKIWETSNNSLKVEFDLKSHVNQTCSSLTWGIHSVDNIEDTSGAKSHVLIIGSHEGNILLYDLSDAILYNNFASGHSDAVTDVQYDPNCHSIYSCSKDSKIISWDCSTGKVKSSWKAGVEPLYSLCLIDKNNLLSSDTAILWWDVEKQTLIKKFNGHKTSVLMIQPVSAAPNSNFYFLSIAREEAQISAWHLSSKNNKTATATFKLEETPLYIDVTKTFSKDKPMMVSAVTKSGSLVLFEHVLNGRIRRNLCAEMTLQVVSKPNSETSEPFVIPILSSKFTDDLNSIIIAYGNAENPVFEKVALKDCPKKLILSRDKPALKSSTKKSDVKVISAFNGQEPSLCHSSSSPKRRRKESESSLCNSSHTKSANSTVSPLSQTVLKSSPVKKSKLTNKGVHFENTQISTNLTSPSDIVNTLIKSLEAQNEELLEMVLNCDNEELIKSSVRILPSHCLEKIMQTLYNRLSHYDRNQSSTRKWTIEILSTHISYLTTCQSTCNIVNQIQTKLDEKKISDTLTKLSSLKGLLNMLRIQGAFSEVQSSSGESDSDEDMCS